MRIDQQQFPTHCKTRGTRAAADTAKLTRITVVNTQGAAADAAMLTRITVVNTQGAAANSPTSHI